MLPLQKINDVDMLVSKTRWNYFHLFLWVAGRRVLSQDTLDSSSSETDNLIGLYTLANEEQCHRLCWYRQLCSSYVYRPSTDVPDTRSSSAATASTCLLFTESGKGCYRFLLSVMNIEL